MGITNTQAIRRPNPALTAEPAPNGHVVVAVVVERRGKIALFKRSRHVAHDQRLWHCVTGFVERPTSPVEQALREVLEETGIERADLLELREGPSLKLDDDFGAMWTVHTFTASTLQRRLKIDWEHEAYRWTQPSKVKRFANRVPWLDLVLKVTGHLGDPHLFDDTRAHSRPIPPHRPPFV